MNWKIILILIILIILVYIFAVIKKSDPYRNDPIEQYDKIKPKLKTGDIILFSCKKTNSLYKKAEYYIRTNFVGSEYGHVGLIVRIDNELYLLECTTQNHSGEKYSKSLNNQGCGGVRLIPLDKMLKIYQRDNAAVFAVKYISQEIPIETLSKNLEKYVDFTFENKNLLLMHGVIDVCISHNLAIWLAYRSGRDKMMCSHFMYQLLYDCGVVKYYPAKLFWPHLVNDKLFDQLQIVQYSKPIKFTIEINKNHNQNNNH